jgi:hypothetical protein
MGRKHQLTAALKPTGKGKGKQLHLDLGQVWRIAVWLLTVNPGSCLDELNVCAGC